MISPPVLVCSQRMDKHEKIPDLGNSVALVTGASAGIGYAYAHYLVRAGATVVVVARRGERLEAMREKWRNEYGANILAVVCDLSDPDAPRTIETALAKAELSVDILINNAGYGLPGKYLDSSWQDHADFERVMVGAIAELSYRLLPGMRSRGVGAIVNIASIAGFLPGTSGHTQYAAVKAWLINFSESLAFEYGDDGIRILAVCPGFTYSEFHDVTRTRELVSTLPKCMWMSADDVVAQSFAALARGDIVFIPGWINRVIVRLTALCPRRLRYALARRESGRFRDQSN